MIELLAGELKAVLLIAGLAVSLATALVIGWMSKRGTLKAPLAVNVVVQGVLAVLGLVVLLRF